MLMVSFEQLFENYYHIEQQYWVDAFLAIVCFQILVVVKIDLQEKLFFIVTVLNVQVRLESVLVGKFQKDFLVIFELDFFLVL